jgi:hypothetical protein
MNFQRIYEKAMKDQDESLREDNSSYELVDPLVGLQSTKKVVVQEFKVSKNYAKIEV